jgi:phage baseplate assembly protein W
MARADRYTIQSKQVEKYSDFLPSFELNPFTGSLARVTNENAVKQALKNLVLTQVGERFYDTNKGSKVTKSLFELFDPQIDPDLLTTQLREAAGLYEPRAIIHEVRLDDRPENNEFAVTIVFSVVNNNDPQQLSLSIQRVR